MWPEIIIFIVHNQKIIIMLNITTSHTFILAWVQGHGRGVSIELFLGVLVELHVLFVPQHNSFSHRQGSPHTPCASGVVCCFRSFSRLYDNFFHHEIPLPSPFTPHLPCGCLSFCRVLRSFSCKKYLDELSLCLASVAFVLHPALMRKL